MESASDGLDEWGTRFPLSAPFSAALGVKVYWPYRVGQTFQAGTFQTVGVFNAVIWQVCGLQGGLMRLPRAFVKEGPCPGREVRTIVHEEKGPWTASLP